MQYLASFEPLEISNEFNGVQGTYIKSFLISDKINLNDWQATHEANITNLDSFLGRPGTHYTDPENGKRDHTGATTFEKSLQIQEIYHPQISIEDIEDDKDNLNYVLCADLGCRGY